jgi:3'5'-cyclic nucleotide phosphodiesterase
MIPNDVNSREHHLQGSAGSPLEEAFVQKIERSLYLPDCVESAIHSQCLSFPASEAQALQNLIAAILVLAVSIEVEGEKLAIEGSEPAYHNRRHFIEVLNAVVFLLAQETLLADAAQWPSDTWPHFNLRERLLLIAAAIGHDFLHTGHINTHLEELEQISAGSVQRILLANGASKDDANFVYALILSTDHAQLQKSHDQVRAITPNQPLDALLRAKVLMSEADVFPSLMPLHGRSLGVKLSQEWQHAGVVGALKAASPAGRAAFLGQVQISSPHARTLGLEALILMQIERLLLEGIASH